MVIPTPNELQAELVAVARTLPAFVESGFSVFDLDDAIAQGAMQQYPLLCVTYDGSFPLARANEANGVASGAGSVVLGDFQFTVIIALQYNYAQQEDTKIQAISLLSALREMLLGYKSSEFRRPWRWLGEKPEREQSEDGLVFYSQVWRTTVPVVGSFNRV